MLFFEAFVVVVDDAAHDLAGFVDRLRWDVFLGVDAPDRLLVDEQQPLEQAVVAHEVFRRWQACVRVALGRWRGSRGVVAAAGGQQKTSRCQR